MRGLAAILPKVTRHALGRQGLAEAGLIADWPEIIGPRLADCCLPIKLSFPPGERVGGTLAVRVMGAMALELQHYEPQVLERVNTYFGYRAVSRLRILQGTVPRQTSSTPGHAPTIAADPIVLSLTNDVADDRLRAALAAFGTALRQPGKRRR